MVFESDFFYFGVVNVYLYVNKYILLIYELEVFFWFGGNFLLVLLIFFGRVIIWIFD